MRRDYHRLEGAATAGATVTALAIESCVLDVLNVITPASIPEAPRDDACPSCSCLDADARGGHCKTTPSPLDGPYDVERADSGPTRLIPHRRIAIDYRPPRWRIPRARIRLRLGVHFVVALIIGQDEELRCGSSSLKRQRLERRAVAPRITNGFSENT